MTLGLRLAVAFCSGALTVAGFAPFFLFPLPLLTFALLVGLWSSASARQAAALGFAFGLGLFLTGVSWIYVSLHDHGGMPLPLAALAVLLFCSVLALFPAASGAAFGWLRSGLPWRDAALAAATWTMFEWIRGWILSGFPWLAIGNTQAPPSPLAGFAPLFGMYGSSFLLLASAACLALNRNRRRHLFAASGLVALVATAGMGLGRIEWTQPVGAPVSVKLLQPNIPQSLKWQPELLGRWLTDNLNLVEANPAQIIVLPETTLPLSLDDLPPAYLDSLEAAAKRAGGDVIFGVFTREQSARGSRYFNTAVSLGSSGSQQYRKRHLVAFGEYSPPGLSWIYRWLSIPMSDQSPGPPGQPPLAIAGQQVAINICYEDAFGEEIIEALPQATLLLNLTNTAWFGRSLAQPQHLQMSQMRALETGRPMLRATNTGTTAVISPQGVVTAHAPDFEPAVVAATVQGYAGLTPYSRIGNWGAIGLSILVLFFALVSRRGSA
ncbi:MAG: apolipoprotein N-acyltransferase [Sterolibacteriaceae bacterium]|nr:apolipoprotein N-acyltransferase [Candidatus Methylophosphatis haderslevensis]